MIPNTKKKDSVEYGKGNQNCSSASMKWLADFTAQGFWGATSRNHTQLAN